MVFDDSFVIKSRRFARLASVTRNLVPRAFHRREPWDGRPTLGGEKPRERGWCHLAFFVAPEVSLFFQPKREFLFPLLLRRMQVRYDLGSCFF